MTFDPAAVDAAIAQIKGKSRPCEDDWELLENAELLADACEHYRAELAAVTELAEVERKELLGRIQLLTHQIITCGVAASHPDAGLASRGVYGNKWDSQQAGEVRALRKRCDDVTARAERMREACIKASAELRHCYGKGSLSQHDKGLVSRAIKILELSANQEGNADGK